MYSRTKKTTVKLLNPETLNEGQEDTSNAKYF